MTAKDFIRYLIDMDKKALVQNKEKDTEPPPKPLFYLILKSAGPIKNN